MCPIVSQYSIPTCMILSYDESIVWTEHKTNEEVLQIVDIERELNDGHS